MKKRNLFATLIIWFGLLSFFCLSTNKPALAGSTVRFKLIRNYMIIVPVWVNGQGPFDFVLDTGTSATVIRSDLAEQLGLRSIDRTVLMNTIDSRIVPRSCLDALTFGPRSVEGLEAIIAELRVIQALHPRIRGVLGQNFLSQFNFLINYRTKQIEFEEGLELEYQLLGVRLATKEVEGRLLVATPHPLQQKTLRFILDSGAPAVVVFEALSQPLNLPIVYGENPRGELCSTTGCQSASRGLLTVLRVGDDNLTRLAIVLVTSRTASDERVEDGLLPTSLFSSIYFNNREKFVILNPRVLPR